MYEFDYNEFPLAYLITFRCYGTWLHGDERGSVDRHGRNIYGTPRIAPNQKLKDADAKLLKNPPVVLDQAQRTVVERAINNFCAFRGYVLQAVNARSNHVHCVVTAACDPESVMSAFKANATRELRESGLMSANKKTWERHGSTRYLWKPRHVALAIEYVLYGQGDLIPDFDD